ncbi:MAG: hypothetical protein M3Z27_10335 [Actinomycetota bacterium]|nr:hypothetical protein [Actinomycetota bacterium]
MRATRTRHPISAEEAAGGAARWAGSLGGRIVRAWRVLPPERRLAAGAAAGLFATLFLPWYQETVLVPGAATRTVLSAGVTGWGAFSFVEAAVLLVAGGVLTLLFQRAEGRAFHLPGGDGWVIVAAGAWACALVLWRIFDKQSTSVPGGGLSIAGVDWGIFVALAVAGLLTLSGSRIRAAHQPEPPLPGDDGGSRRRRESQASEPEAGLPATRRTAPRVPTEPTGSERAPTPTPVPAAGTWPTAAPRAAVPAREAEDGATEPRPASEGPRRSSRIQSRSPGWLSARPRHLNEEPEDAEEERTTRLDRGD